jgi:hypothetical protein
MLLVPRQLQRVGMTGNVPYYGGRMSPQQAYAASHQTPGPPAATPPAPPRNREESLADLQNLLSDGLLSADEYRDLEERLGR